MSYGVRLVNLFWLDQLAVPSGASRPEGMAMQRNLYGDAVPVQFATEPARQLGLFNGENGWRAAAEAWAREQRCGRIIGWSVRQEFLWDGWTCKPWWKRIDWDEGRRAWVVSDLPG